MLENVRTRSVDIVQLGVKTRDLDLLLQVLARWPRHAEAVAQALRSVPDPVLGYLAILEHPEVTLDNPGRREAGRQLLRRYLSGQCTPDQKARLEGLLKQTVYQINRVDRGRVKTTYYTLGEMADLWFYPHTTDRTMAGYNP